MASIDHILDKALEGQRLGKEDALALFASTDILLLGNAAARRAAQKAPDGIVTYIIDRNVNYTNICVTECAFCAFYRGKNDPDAYVLPLASIAAKIEETIALGGRQILLQGGHNAELKIEYFEDLFRRIKERFDVCLHALSPPEIAHLSRVSRLPVDAVLERLRAAGLDSIPGGGAEILVDRVRQQISPAKCSAGQWLDVMDRAHRLGIPTTATMMFGHVETLEERIEHLLLLRAQQDKSGGFTAFIPWPFQPGGSPLGFELEGRKVTGFEYLKTLAISRLLLDNFANIQSSWVTQGPKIGQLALFYGANDMGSVMIEENVVREAGTSFRLTEQEIRRLIADGGFTPQRRNMRYQHI